MASEGITLKQRAVREFKEYIYVAIYLWVFFGAFIVYKSVVLAEHQIDYVGNGVALINALALGKIIVIAKAFRPGRRADDAPLIYPTLLKAAMFAIILGVFKIVEDVVIGFFRGRSFAESIADLTGGRWKALFALLLILFIVLIPLTAFQEVQRIMGEGALARLFLRPRDRSKTLQT